MSKNNLMVMKSQPLNIFLKIPTKLSANTSYMHGAKPKNENWVDQDCLLAFIRFQVLPKLVFVIAIIPLC